MDKHNNNDHHHNQSQVNAFLYYCAIKGINVDNNSKSKCLYVFVHEPTEYTRLRLLDTINKHPNCVLVTHPSLSDLQWEYDESQIHWERVFKGELIANSYYVRKGLIRKAQMAKYLTKYIWKHPDSALKNSVPKTIVIDISNPKEVGWALSETQDEFEDPSNSSLTWILKPSMANGAVGIHILKSNYEDLKKLITQYRDLQQWVLQEYISKPLLINTRKFHLRAYVLAIGNLAVYLYKDVLALFAQESYVNSDFSNKYAHITNTCLQVSHPEFKEDDIVKLLTELDFGLNSSSVASLIFNKMVVIIKDTFLAFKGDMSGFFPLKNCFELFGVDLLVDENYNVWLLEFNSGPDLKQTGNRINIIKPMIDDLWNLVVDSLFLKKENATPQTGFELVYKEENNQWGHSGITLT